MARYRLNKSSGKKGKRKGKVCKVRNKKSIQIKFYGSGKGMKKRKNM